MYDRNMLRDRTLILRILDDRLRERLTEKMTALEKSHYAGASLANENKVKNAAANSLQHDDVTHSMIPTMNNDGSAGAASDPKKEGHVFDLEGVTCEPAIKSHNDAHQAPDGEYTLWNFICDGATYPARLTNLPCPVEIHKTHDHVMYYKCTDVAQMLIVYEDDAAMEEAESSPGYHVDGFPSYFHSGLTPPMHKVVERRFKERDHAPLPPPCQNVHQMELEILDLISRITSSADGKIKPKRGPGTSVQIKVVEEIEDEIVPWEPWMDYYGKEPNGIKFEEGDMVSNAHPEIWLNNTSSLDKLKIDEEIKKEEAKQVGNSTIKLKKTKKKKKKTEEPATVTAATTTTTTGAPTPVSRPESTTAAALQNGHFDDFNFDIDDLDLDEDNIDLDDMEMILT
jgi:transcription initiation factor TFIID subunit 7